MLFQTANSERSVGFVAAREGSGEESVVKATLAERV
jgi:hypothetical protein